MAAGRWVRLTEGVFAIKRRITIIIIVLGVIFLTGIILLPGCGGAKTQEGESQPAQEESFGPGHTYYVSPGGSDSNPGSSDAPWATPGFGSKQLQPGDTMVIMAGRYPLREYWDDMITPASGEEGAPITIKGAEGERPVLAGGNDLFSAVDISDKSYITMKNLEITSDDGASFRGGIEGSGGPVGHIALEDLYIHHIDESGMNFGDVTDMKITNCEISYCGFGCIMGPEGSEGGWRNVIIDGCTLSYSGHYYQGGDGPGPYDRPDGFGIEPSQGPVEIRNTLCEHNLGDGLDSKSANTYIHECVVANNSCDGVKLWRGTSRVENTLIYGAGDGVGGSSPWAGIVVDSEVSGDRFEFVNVTLEDNPAREAYPAYFQYEMATPIDVLMRNTIIAGGSGPAYFGDSVNLTSDHDIFYRPGGGAQVYANGRDYSASEIDSGALGEGNLSLDPMFVAPAWGDTGDYHLEAGSPAVDAGSAEGAPGIDLDLKARPAGNGYDIGAYEYGSS